MSTKTRLAGCGLMLALFVVLPGLYIAGGPYTETIPRPFDSKIWKSTDTWGKTRCSMLADLRARIGVQAKTRAELVELLGPEEDKDTDASVSHWHLCPSFMDVWILEVRWKDGVVVDSWVRDT